MSDLESMIRAFEVYLSPLFKVLFLALIEGGRRKLAAIDTQLRTLNDHVIRMNVWREMHDARDDERYEEMNEKIGGIQRDVGVLWRGKDRDGL